VRACFASLFKDRAIAYRAERGIDHLKVAQSVGIMKMVRSDCAASGVIFTLDTETGFRDVVFVTGAYGLGENVVQGTVDPDEFYVFRPTFSLGHRTVLRRKLGSKDIRMVYAQGAGCDTGASRGRVVTRCRSRVSRSGVKPSSRSPPPHATGVDVHEVLARIEPDPAHAQRQRGIAEVAEGDAGKADVDRPPFHVEAVCRHAASARAAQQGVRGRTPVARNDLEGAPGAQRGLNAEQRVEEPGIHRADVAAVVVAQEAVEMAECLRHIAVADGVDDLDALAGVQVRHREGARVGRGGVRRRPHAGQRNRRRGTGRVPKEAASRRNGRVVHGLSMAVDVDVARWRKAASSSRSCP